MKIIEALKELPLIEKRIRKNIQSISEYSSDLDKGDLTDLPFGTADKQRKEIASLIQANNDLIARKAQLRRDLAFTNTQVKVSIDGVDKSISEWIEYRENGMSNLISTYEHLTDKTARSKVQNSNVDLAQGVKTIRFYDQKQRDDSIRSYQNIADKIDSSLEIINATTDLKQVA